MLADDWMDRCQVTHDCSKYRQKFDQKSRKQPCPRFSSTTHTSVAALAPSSRAVATADNLTLFPSSSAAAAAAAAAYSGVEGGNDAGDDGKDKYVRRLRLTGYNTVEIVDQNY